MKSVVRIFNFRESQFPECRGNYNLSKFITIYSKFSSMARRQETLVKDLAESSIRTVMEARIFLHRLYENFRNPFFTVVTSRHFFVTHFYIILK